MLFGHSWPSNFQRKKTLEAQVILQVRTWVPERPRLRVPHLSQSEVLWAPRQLDLRMPQNLLSSPSTLLPGQNFRPLRELQLVSYSLHL